MGWEWLRAHQGVVEKFRTALQRERLASTFLFIGPDGVGKRSVAIEIARAMLCEQRDERQLDACGQCPSCKQVAAGVHPDLLLVSKPEDKAVLPIDLFIGDREHRMRAGLCHDIALKPSKGVRKAAIIDDADFFNHESANCLLKTLEEPPLGSVLFLIGTSEQKQLPTIRSRCQVIRFGRLSTADIAELLAAEGLAEGDDAQRIAQRSEGSIAVARELASESASQFRAELLSAITDPNCNCTGVIKQIQDFVEADNAEPPLKRQRMRQTVAVLASYYRRLVQSLCGAAARHGDELDSMVAAAAKWWPGEELAVDCLDRCLIAEQQVAANVNQATWTECLVADLARAAAGIR